jgi:glycosyltransferase involved in cell wall biosynthesis
VIAFVGSFQPWHGAELLVEGYAGVCRQLPDARLVLIGDGERRQAVVEQVCRLGLSGKVILTGKLNQEQVAALLNAADVLVAPYPFKHSDIVGTPLKLLEYMAVGKGILASTAPIHEVIVNGVTGLRIAPADADALAQGLLLLLQDNDLRARLGKNARQIAAQRYSWDCVVEKLETIFQAQIDGNHPVRSIYHSVR